LGGVGVTQPEKTSQSRFSKLSWWSTFILQHS
jgi:hypothetical protein